MTADDRCKKRSFAGWSQHGLQCKRKATGGHGFCAIHSPEGVAKREAKQKAYWEQRHIGWQKEREEKEERERKLAVFPELLAACKSALCLIESLPDDSRQTLRINDEVADAIAKAEGRS